MVLYQKFRKGHIKLLKISKLSDYAMLIMNEVAKHQGQTLSASVLASSLKLSLPTVSKVLKLLADAGWLDSLRGANGGYCLNKKPSDISVADIVMAIEGKPALTECSMVKNSCGIDHDCELRGNWQFINRVVYRVLDSISLNDMGASLETSHVKFHNLSSEQKQKLLQGIN